MSTPQAALLPGNRLHLQHGPIDLVIAAEGPPGAREAAFDAARRRFATILEELVAELPALRRPPDGGAFTGPTARRMAAAVAPFRDVFITPMAAVAGAVAEEVQAAMLAAAPLERAWVNNGGDIALHLPPPARGAKRPGQRPPAPQAGASAPTTGGRRPLSCPTFTIAIAAPNAAPLGTISIAPENPVRGIATSGRGGRSLSLGVADCVTVLARSAASADAAATLIANAVDLPGHPAIARRPAHVLQPDSDLGAREVVTGLGHLGDDEIAAALARGTACARRMLARGLIHSAALFLRGRHRIAGPWPQLRREEKEHA